MNDSVIICTLQANETHKIGCLSNRTANSQTYPKPFDEIKQTTIDRYGAEELRYFHNI